MFKHNLKIAFRNMRKYFNQTLISVIGLSVGFTCFALATLWIRYEMTYDSFHKNAKHLYVIYSPDSFNPTGFSRGTPNPLAVNLKETFPEIVSATTIIPPWSMTSVTVNDVEYPQFALVIMTDSSFFRFFDIKILEGSRDCLVPVSKNIAITQEKARQLFGNEPATGKTITLQGEELTICAVVSGMSKQSNYSFDIIRAFQNVTDATNGWTISNGEHTLIELLAGTNVEAFEKKLYEHDPSPGRGRNTNLTIRPLTKVRYTDSTIDREVKFQHILIFALSGLLVVLCSLFNYLTLFVSRFRIRIKELALRMVCGASGRSLLAMLSVEFILTILFAVVLGFSLTQLFHKSFLTLSEIRIGLPAIYRESLVYISALIIISLLAFWLILFIFRHRSLNVSIRRSKKNLSRKISVIVQLVISVGFAFCTIIILKQMYFLHHTDELGFAFKNRATVRSWTRSDGSAIANQLKQIPEIIEVVNAPGTQSIVPLNSRTSRGIQMWDGKPADAADIRVEFLDVTPEYNAFYDFRLLAGEMLTDADPESYVLINESAVKAFGWEEPVGKRFGHDYGLTVKGVIRNVYHFAPTVEAKPFVYRKNSQGNVITTVLFKYQEGTWKSCKKRIEELIEKEFADMNFQILNSEEEYDKFLKSEAALMRLLSVVSAICILICVFGFVSLISLTCEERRKSIAIRKVHGATVGDILGMFTKEYSLLLIIGASIAFPVSYLIMQRWLEQYVKQTSIAAWIYLSILFVLALAIVVCVGWQVYKSSVENPAEVVKSE